MSKRGTKCHYRVETKGRGDYYGGATKGAAQKRQEELRRQGIRGRIVKSCSASTGSIGMTRAVEVSCKKKWGWYSVGGLLAGEAIGFGVERMRGKATMQALSGAVPVAVASGLITYLLGSTTQCARV